MTALTYTKKGDYLYPDLTLPESEELTPLGKYGLMHKKYLEENRGATYQRLLLGGTLEGHLREIDREANSMMEKLTQEMARSEGVTESMKASDQMAWVGAMNNIRNRAEEIVLTQLVYR